MDDIMDKIGKRIQIGVSVMFLLFTLFNLVRIFLQTFDVFLAICFAALFVLSLSLLKISWKELRGEANINCNGEDKI